MLFVISRYNQGISWTRDYTDEVIIYDRSEKALAGSNPVPNIGTDIYDKLSFIIEFYDDLPQVALYTKANLFDYITPKEFEKVYKNTTFTPILTQNHKTYIDGEGRVCYYQDGLYYERNNYWYLHEHPAKYAKQLINLFKMYDRQYNGFAPGSNYIVPRENILKHDKSYYEQLRSYLDWAVYPGDAQIIERNLYYLWK